MKISTSEPHVYGLDEIDIKETLLKLYRYGEKEFLEEYECYAKPIVLEDLRMWIDGRGILCLRFDTKNHKYLKIESGSCILGFDSCTRVIELKTSFTAKVKGMEFDYPVSSIEIKLSPENEHEEEFTSAWTELIATPLKWEYELMFVPITPLNREAEVFQLEPEQPKSIKL